MPATASTATRRFSVNALGPARREADLRREVETAFAEALEEASSSAVPLRGSVEPEGGLLEGGLDLWLLTIAVAGAKAAGLGAAAAVGKKVVDHVWDSFARRLRSRNVLVTKASARDASRPAKGSPATSAKSARKPSARPKGPTPAKAARNRRPSSPSGPSRSSRRGAKSAVKR